ncbi:hypothetical protein AMELA_G00214690 [Ameiurus melas]|uniref:Protein THEM6 n=1 Tax=Ameiurus melas TaxID=219545 RepID=A0A7J6A4K8_AMEME|nr:hypothetical protein AMELA_G00214690 [Ameiurus melas]
MLVMILRTYRPRVKPRPRVLLTNQFSCRILNQYLEQAAFVIGPLAVEAVSKTKRVSGHGGPGVVGVGRLAAEQAVGGHVLLNDIDMCHMNNARYLRECDFARISLCARNGVMKATRALGAAMVAGAITVRYRRPLCVGEKFELRTRIVTWDEKAFYIEQRFVSSKDGMVAAVLFCKMNVIRGSPDKILQHLCKRKVEAPEFPEELQHWISFITASSQALKSESGLEKKSQ